MLTAEEECRDTSKCPSCEGENTEYGSISIEGGLAFQDAECLDCTFEWTDKYEYYGYAYQSCPEEIVHVNLKEGEK